MKISKFDKDEGYVLQMTANNLSAGKQLVKPDILRKTFELIGCMVSEEQFDIIMLYADENNSGEILI